MDRRPPFHHPTDSHAVAPLLQSPGDLDRGRTSRANTPPTRSSSTHSNRRPFLSRRSTMRSVSPSELAREAARRKYSYAAFFFLLVLVSFAVQTELSAYIQGDLGWDKAYCMLYLTHGSWSMLWPAQLLILRMQKLDLPWDVFWRRHAQLLRSTAAMVELRRIDVDRASVMHRASPLRYMARTTAVVTTALTVAGLSWYIAVSMTTPSDLTAIYNCSAFFAYAFSVPLLNEPLRRDKSLAVAVAIAGVLIVAYGDVGSGTGTETPDPETSRRSLGNIIIGLGSVLYGLYEVLYKRLACPPEGVSPGRGTIFAMGFASLIGVFTLTVLWMPLPILHLTGVERFSLPSGHTAFLLLLSVIANATFAGSFLVLISLTSPVLSSVASLLTIFVVAVIDWLFTGKPLGAASILGGGLITVAFLMLAWSTWREMAEEQEKKVRELGADGMSDLSDEEEDP
ncbi:related to DUF6 domain protein [Cephalotrichum gorgonifer]|uniref:Related to DUF6 domain protein n=1 Tax=Cephalotrichum gorgonifer TaxID=2041049 RepID=A0AAE8MQ24_9PEZI|nr:related to DUF6 domain protein [Cephalotrichum gorgonifer]